MFWLQENLILMKKMSKNCSTCVQLNRCWIHIGITCCKIGTLTKLPFSGHPDNHICWVTSMPFASIYPMKPRSSLWNFVEKYWELVDLKKWHFLILQIPNSKFQNSFFSSPLKSVANYGVAWLGLYFYDYHDFQPKIRPGVYRFMKHTV